MFAYRFFSICERRCVPHSTSRVIARDDGNRLGSNVGGNRFFSSKEKKKEEHIQKNFSFIFPEPSPDNYIKWTEMRLLNPQLNEDFQQLKLDQLSFQQPKRISEDESAVMTLKAPKGYLEDGDLATKLGFNKYYKRTPSPGTSGLLKDTASIGVTFYPRDTKKANDPPTTDDHLLASEKTATPLDKFLAKQRMLFFQDEPAGTVTTVHLNSLLTTHNLEKNGLPFQAVIFNDGLDVLTRAFHRTFHIGKANNAPRMSLFVETLAGFWEFACFNNATNMLVSKVQKDSFAEMVKNISVQLRTVASKVDEKSPISSSVERPSTEEDAFSSTSTGAKLALKLAHNLKKKPVIDKKRKRPSARGEAESDNSSNNSEDSV